MKFKKFYKYLFITIFLLSANKSFANETLAYIDFDYIMTKSLAGLYISKQITDNKIKNIQKLKKIEKDINEKDKKLTSQKNILSKEDFKKKVVNLRNEAAEYEKLRNKYIQESNNQLIQAQANFIKMLTPILGDYSNKNNISMIFQKKNVVIGKTELDITKNILEIVNKEIKKVKIN